MFYSVTIVLQPHKPLIFLEIYTFICFFNINIAVVLQQKTMYFILHLCDLKIQHYP